jgi:CheY-like chemotaxis protein
MIQNGSASDGRKPIRVLVADDQAVNRKLTMRQLERLGIAADMAANGNEALEAMRQTQYDLVFMDCHMPEMDGFRATEEIRRREKKGRRTPIIALTASIVGPDRQRCTDAGMDDFITKPVSESELRRVLNQWIRPSIDTAKTTVLQDIDGVLHEVIGIYLTEAPARIEGIRTALAANDARGLATEAHALRSSSGNVGATRVHEICGQLETIGRAGRVSEAADLLRELELEYARASNALRKLQQT